VVKKSLKKRIVKKQIDDEAFIKRYFELDENGTALGKELGVGPSTICMRLNRIGRDKIEQARKNGIASVVVAKALEKVSTQRTPAFEGYRKGVNDAAEAYSIFDGLEHLASELQPLLANLINGIREKGKAKPFEIDQACKLVSRLESLSLNAHKIRIEMLKDEGTKAFMRSMVEIYLEELPDVRERLHHKLARYGLEGQVSLVNPGS
jgi:hypothetical protein